MPAIAKAKPIGLPELPSLFHPTVALREGGDAMGRAIAIAPRHGAGTLAWVRSAARVEAAVVLEPEGSLASSRLALFAAMSALGDALAAFGPPEVPLTFAWPVGVKVNGGHIGRARMAWPKDTREEGIPDWLVVGVEARIAFPHGWEPGHGLHQTALVEEGWDEAEATCQELTAAWARHLMAGIAEWQRPGPTGGVKRLAEKFLARLEREESMGEAKRGLDPASGDLVLEKDGVRHVWSLLEALEQVK